MVWVIILDKHLSSGYFKNMKNFNYDLKRMQESIEGTFHIMPVLDFMYKLGERR